MNSILLLFVLVGYSVLVSASHFRGGSITWRYTGQGNKVEFKYRLGWALGSANDANWKAVLLNGSSSFIIGNGSYIQTATNVGENWEQGEKTFVYDFPTRGPYSVSFTGGDWISLGFGSGGNWKLETIVDLNNRNDTMKPNYCPLTTSRAMYRVQFGCQINVKIPMFDADGDNVRCRWATNQEAASISNILPNARLDENTCRLHFNVNGANNYTNNAWYAVALTMEDFPKKTITINGKVYTPTTPISKVPLQFLIKTETVSGSTCKDKPTFVHPTPQDGEVKVVKAGKTLKARFYLYSVAGLQAIDITGPIRMTKSSKTVDDLGRSNVWYVEITWTPRQPDQGTYMICASGEDKYSKLSDTRCFTVIAWDIDPCENIPCQHKGNCSRVGFTKDYICTCVAGYTGMNCETNINECASSPCQHGGSCQDLINSYKCNCLAGYTGDNCQTNIDECQSSPCQHDGTCTDLVNGYICSCINGFNGTHCEIDINECATSPCQHSGSCLDLIDAYKCHCLDGYTGDSCQTNINECQSNPCQHGGTCTDLVNGYICQCVNGYNGTHCQIDVNECKSSPCFNNATCIDGIASWSCVCMAGFTGVSCQIDIDECNSYPCLHNGTCVDLINDYSCICANDSKGRNCEIGLDHCQSMPCLHGGVCENKLGGYTCNCPHRWYGDICEYSEINRTEVCTDLKYTECSCHRSKVRQPVKKSYKVWSGLVGAVTGLVTTILFYIAWAHQGYDGSINNKVKPNEVKNDDVSVSDIDAESNSTDSKEDEIIVSAGPIHCTCFVDHTGYDHFQRYDPKNNRFRFHNCRHKKTITKQTSIASSKSSC